MRNQPPLSAGAAALVFALACAGAKTPAVQAPHAEPAERTGAHQGHHGHAAPNDRVLAAVASVHGGAGPWAVAGYRMGDFALRELALSRGSFELEVVHHSPREVQFSCIADGAAAATGASLGKLNLSLAEAAAPDTHTEFRNRATGKVLVLRPTREFSSRYADVPRERLGDAGREVLELTDAQIFEVVGAGPTSR